MCTQCGQQTYSEMKSEELLLHTERVGEALKDLLEALFSVQDVEMNKSEYSLAVGNINICYQWLQQVALRLDAAATSNGKVQ